MSKPQVLLPSDVRQVGIHPFHCVGEQYITAILNGADAIPVLMPSEDSPLNRAIQRVRRESISRLWKGKSST